MSRWSMLIKTRLITTHTGPQPQITSLTMQRHQGAGYHHRPYLGHTTISSTTSPWLAICLGLTNKVIDLMGVFLGSISTCPA